MAQRIDAEHDQDDGQAAVVSLRPGTATPAIRARPAAQPLPPPPSRDEPHERRTPIWDKNNFGFWLTVCILLSLVFSIIWRAIG